MSLLIKKEVFKNIKGYNGLYQISNRGRVKSLKRSVDKILSPGIVKGYEQVRLYKDGKRSAISRIQNKKRWGHL